VRGVYSLSMERQLQAVFDTKTDPDCYGGKSGKPDVVASWLVNIEALQAFMEMFVELKICIHYFIYTFGVYIRTYIYIYV
jgi:hypothetical protein